MDSIKYPVHPHNLGSLEIRMHPNSGWILECGGMQYPIPSQGLRIGRDATNDVVLIDPQISRHHATVWETQGNVYIRDDGSMNGTFVNGNRITTPVLLQPTDQVQIGSSILTAHLEKAEVVTHVGMPVQLGQPAQQRNSKVWWMVGGLGAAALLTICGILVWVLVSGSQPQAAAIAPADSPMYLGFGVDLNQALKGKRFMDIYQKNAALAAGGILGSVVPSDWKSQLLGQSGLDFDQDIAPWIGPDVGLFLTDSKSLKTQTTVFPNGSASNLAIALGTRDKGKSDVAVKRIVNLARSQGATVSEFTFGNTKADVVKQQYGTPAYIATVQNYVVLTTSEEAMRAVVDSASAGGAKTLAGNPKYKDALARLPSSRLGTLYLSYSTFADLTRSSGLPQSAMADAIDAIVGTLSFSDDGLRVDLGATINQSKLSDPQKRLLVSSVSANQIVNAMPANTLFYVSGTGLKQNLEGMLEAMDPTAKASFQSSMDVAGRQLGVDLGADLFGWMTGEYALGVIPAPQSDSFRSALPSGIGVLVVVEAKDKPLINSKLKQLNDAFAKNGVAFKEQSIEGVAMQVAPLAATQFTNVASAGVNVPSIGYGFVGNFWIAGADSLTVLTEAARAPKNPLANADNFKKVRSNLPGQNSGLAYLNVSALEDLVYGTMSGTAKRDYEQNVRPLLKPIKAMGASFEAGRSDFWHTTVFIHISDP